MWPEVGHLALTMAAWVALLQAVLPLWGSLSVRRAGWQALARPLALLQLGLIALAFGALWHAFVVHDFSVKYVAQHSNTLLPTPYRLSAIWAGHEGSLLLWVFMLALWSVAVGTFSRRLPQVLVAQVLGVMGAVSVGFLAFILTLSNPFARQFPPPLEGRDLSPLLQDPGLVIHPPMLYMGYVGMSVAFAFAMAALLSGRLDAAWARWARPWTVAAWGFLTLGIALGSWWAYYELGWGGWWFWDPVENASLMPWLVATALIHSLMVTDKRGQFKAWTVLLAIGAFSLSLLGTFLVRSGVLTSVHAFATDPGRGIFILLFLAVVVGVSLALFAWRAPQWAHASQPVVGSRESFLLLNSVLLVVAMAAVLLGTLYPLIIDALNLGKLSVGPPYFDRVFVPLMVPLLLAMVPGTVVPWHVARWAAVRSVWVPGALALGLASAWASWGGAPATDAGTAVGTTAGGWITVMGGTLGGWIALSGAWQIGQRWRLPGSPGLAWWGMHVAHVGVAVLVLGITGVKSFQVERDVRMGLGDEVTVAGYRYRLLEVGNQLGPNYLALRGQLAVFEGDQRVRTLTPEKRRYVSSAMPMTEAAIDSSLWRDLYVSLGEPLAGEPPQWSFRIYHKPFVSWIWLGAVFMVLGGGLAAFDRRYRQKAAVPRLSGMPMPTSAGHRPIGGQPVAVSPVASGAAP
ncbi:c-type cytochrome biogenesis protein CcmF [Limnohabitans sp. 2KL-1]|uniref:heme lyase CcmF/NrfE family subunit n=1 Tax=Limnohabitans sp. 2KL-1 TaxID=1100699 RepID=UPI000D3B69CD|nr:heme lyase CcmF/NrfE family subunit [Limnohabitans sp. 2KL-1]PUE45193.1 c-type cytochrome biogenesis protein CcmF [Limnohabitans sp. 2KL-1]